MNDKIKQAVEHFGGVWPYGDKEVIVASTPDNYIYGAGTYQSYRFCGLSDPFKDGDGIVVWGLVCTKQQFEDYVRENKMDKQYKYVNAGIKTVGELYDRIDTDDNGCFVGEEQLCIITDGCSISFESKLEPLSLGEIKQLLSNVTTRQPFPWYEQDGVFPCLVKYNSNGEVYLIKSMDGEHVVMPDGWLIHVDYCTPLTSEQAAKYGVLCED